MIRGDAALCLIRNDVAEHIKATASLAADERLLVTVPL